jgi:hypothetical protein
MIIECENNFKMRLMGFTNFAFKLEEENKTIIYCVPDNLASYKQEKIKYF